MRKSTRITLFLFLILGFSRMLGQNEASKWFFGGYAGLDFMTTTPSTITGSGMQAYYGCASIADAAGNLLFYTDGQNIFTSTHTIMANGSGLMSYSFVSQPALIVPNPGNSSQYYVFGVNGNNSNNQGVYYSLVDMTLASGQGSVVSKNNTLYAGYVGGKITGTKHCNGSAYWVVIRDHNTSSSAQNFRSYSVTATGVSTTAVVSAATSFSYNNYYYYDAYGCMKISPNGRKLALAHYGNYYYYNNQNYHSYELWDFDNSTGVVTNSLGLGSWTNTSTYYNYGAWGVEFSPDNTKLYGSRYYSYNYNGSMSQWDLCAGSPSAIAASEYTFGSSSSTNYYDWHGSMQLAPNGKIYISNWYNTQNNSQAISVINSPNALGSSCSYSFLAQNIAPGNSYWSLPNFIGSYFTQPPPVPPFTHTVSNTFGCQAVAFTSPATPNMTVSSCATVGYSLQNLQWNFGDPASGAANTSTVTNPTHAYTSLGTYTAMLILHYTCGGGIDTIRQVVNVNQPCISVTSSSITCASLGSATVVSTGGVGPFSFTWMPTNQTSSVATGLSPGSYTLTVFDFGNNFTYTAQTIFTSLIPLTGDFSFQPTVACFGAQTATAGVTNIGGGSSSQSYLWVSGTTSITSPTPLLSAGIWSLVVTDNLTGCEINEVFFISQPPALNLALSASSPTACAGRSITLTGVNSGGTPGYSYTWTAGPASDTYVVSRSVAGTYSYVLGSTDTLGCFIKDTIAVTFVQNPVLSLPTTSICPLETGTLQVSGASTYLWFDNTTGNTFTATPSSSASYSVIGSALGCTTAASASIIIKPLPNPLFASNSPRCNGQTLNFFATGGTSYYWTGPQNFTSNSQNPAITNASPAMSGQYNFTVTAANSCTAAQSGTVIVHPTPTISASGSTVCVTQPMVLNSSSEPGATFQWTGPQSFFSTSQNPAVLNPSVNMSGNYLVTAYSTFNCTNTAVANVTITAVPVPSFVTNSPVCDQKVLTFNSSPTTGGVNFQWTGPDNFSSQQLNPVISPVGLQSAGDYTLTVTTGPCIASISKQVVVNSLPQPSIAGPDETCETKNFSLSVSDNSHQIVSYYWQYPAGGSVQQAIFVDSVKPYNGGIYTATVTDVNGCKGSASKQITILANPTISAVGDTVCLNSPAHLKVQGASTYYWTGRNLSVNYGAIATVSRADYVNPETYIVTGTAVNGCTAVTTAQVHTSGLPKPVIAVSPKNRLCVNSELVLEGNGGAEYDWYTPEGAAYSGQKVSLLIRHMSMGGQYTLTVTDPYGCKNSAVTTVIVDPAPDGALVSKVWDACSPFCSDFTFQPAWLTPNASAVFSLDNRIVGHEAFQKCFLTPGEYVITGKLSDSLTGCVNTQTYLVNARRSPSASFSWLPEKPVETFDDVALLNTSIGEGQTKWSWNIEGYQEVIESENTSYTFHDAGIYRVAYIVENKWGCADTVVKTIEIAADFSFYMPDAFTPDGDGKNDVFTAVTRGVKKYSLQVFNRWGEQMFSSSDTLIGWDGTASGKLCKSDAYVWKATVSTNKGEQKEYQGHVVLIR